MKTIKRYKSNLFLKMSSLLILFFMNTANAQLHYKKCDVNTCINYIKSFGIRLNDWDPELSVDSKLGRLYTLPTKEIVLIPIQFRTNYEGFIYPDLDAFNSMKDSDYFPVSEKYQTFWEIERLRLKELPDRIEPFEDFLKKELMLEAVVYTEDWLNDTYKLLAKYITVNKDSVLVKRLLLSYAVIVMKYLVLTYKAEWQFLNRYETYNSYKFPYVVLDGEVKTVIGSLFETLKDGDENYELFKKLVGI